MTSTPLASEACVPCRHGIAPLSPPEAELLRTETPAWSLEDAGTRIERRLRFKTFAAAFSAAERIASLAEEQGHHPDLCVGWGYLTISLRTHTAGGLHRNDFVLAAKIEALLAA